MIHCVIIDDVQQNISILNKLLNQYCPDVSVAGQACKATEALQLIRQQQPQLVFLDIEMPEMNAFDLLNQLKPFNFELILVTAFDQYALKAFSYNALHYLLKPVDIDDLRLAVQKAATRIMEKDIHKHLDAVITNNNLGSTFSKIALPTRQGLAFYPVDEIICCTAKNTYTLFEFLHEKELLVTGTLGEYEDQLPASTFCRVHNSYLININHVKQYFKGKGGQIEMINGKFVEVSLRKREDFLNRIRIYK